MATAPPAPFGPNCGTGRRGGLCRRRSIFGPSPNTRRPAESDEQDPGRKTGSVREVTTTDLVTWGDQANARRDWKQAAAYYAAALRTDPSLVATWVQFGHALKEQGFFGLAEAAYRRAAARGPQSTDALVQLGHFLNRTKQHTEARELFRRAAALESGSVHLETEAPRSFEEANLLASSDDVDDIIANIFGDGPSTSGRGVPRVSRDWPPAAVANYWLTQVLRDYLIYRFGEEYISLYQYLMSVVAAYRSSHDEFVTSLDRKKLIERARALAQARYREAPEVTVVIPVYNNVVYTLTSIVSLLETAGELSFEIVVGDDQSSELDAGSHCGDRRRRPIGASPEKPRLSRQLQCGRQISSR